MPSLLLWRFTCGKRYFSILACCFGGGWFWTVLDLLERVGRVVWWDRGGKGGWDWIVANPPWITLGVARHGIWH